MELIDALKEISRSGGRDEVAIIATRNGQIIEAICIGKDGSTDGVISDVIAATMDRRAGRGRADSKWLAIDIRTTVRVKLTDHGRRLHRVNHDRLYRYTNVACEYDKPREDADGWSEWLLIDLINEFGEQQIALGKPAAFEDKIQIKVSGD